eukprot:1142216-Pelagomonas_calceolata.AAC.7
MTQPLEISETVFRLQPESLQTPRNTQTRQPMLSIALQCMHMHKDVISRLQVCPESIFRMTGLLLFIAMAQPQHD